MTIVDLQREISNFIDRKLTPAMTITAKALNGLLGDVFGSALELFEADKLGTMGLVKAILIGIRSNLDETHGYWQPAARCASATLVLLLQDHVTDLEPLISIAARLNPNYPHVVLFDESARLQTTADIIDGATKFAELQPPPAGDIDAVSARPQSSYCCGKLLSYMRTRTEAGPGEATIKSRVQ
jgi:hypothetical protein